MDINLLQKPNNEGWAVDTDLQRVFVRSQSVVSRLVGGETLIVPVRGKVGDLASIYSFNQIGSLIWQLLEVPRNLAELVSVVAQEYEVEKQRAQDDVTKFVNDMLSAGLIETANLAAIIGAATSAQ